MTVREVGIEIRGKIEAEIMENCRLARGDSWFNALRPPNGGLRRRCALTGTEVNAFFML